MPQRSSRNLTLCGVRRTNKSNCNVFAECPVADISLLWTVDWWVVELFSISECCKYLRNFVASSSHDVCPCVRFVDRCRTTNNMLGDCYGAAVVEHLSRYCTVLYCTVLCASPGPSWTRTPGTRRRGAGSARSLKYNVLKIIKIYSVTCWLEEGIKCNIYPIKEKTKERQYIVISLVNEW